MLKFVAKDRSMITLREPKMSDAKALLNFINDLVEEGAPILRDKKVTLAEERAWLRNQMKAIRDGEVIMLIAEKNGEVIATCEVKKRRYKMAHIANFGIAIRRKYRRMGIGEAISREVLRRAKRSKIEIIKLSVFKDNEPAKALYRKLGFAGEAVLRNEIKVGKNYKDLIRMSLYFKKSLLR
jgi:RimJ/RimL family protein N-acetyltransferase